MVDLLLYLKMMVLLLQIEWVVIVVLLVQILLQFIEKVVDDVVMMIHLPIQIFRLVDLVEVEEVLMLLPHHLERQLNLQNQILMVQ